MKFRIPIWTIGIMMLIASCKNKSAGDEKTDTLSTTTTTTNEGMNPVISTSEVPVGIRTTFEEKYPQATNVRWQYYRPAVEPYYIDWTWTGWPTLDTTDYVAMYTWDGTDYMSWYDDQGTWVGTVATVTDHSSLPAAVNNTINTQYKGYTITSVKKENDKDRTAYEVTLESGTDHARLLIDENGNIMKKKITAGGVTTKEKMNPKDTAQ